MKPWPPKDTPIAEGDAAPSHLRDTTTNKVISLAEFVSMPYSRRRHCFWLARDRDGAYRERWGEVETVFAVNVYATDERDAIGETVPSDLESSFPFKLPEALKPSDA